MKQLKFLAFLCITLFTISSVAAINVEVLSTDPAPLEAGKFADITLQVTSDVSQDPFTDVTVSVDNNNILNPLQDQVNVVSLLQPGQSATRTIRVFVNRATPQGDVDIPFIVNTGEGRFTFNKAVFIDDADQLPELEIGEIQTTPDELLPDTDDNKITITLQNLGDETAELLTSELIVDPAKARESFAFSLRDSVASIGAASETELEFDMDILEDVFDPIPARLDLRYRVDDDINTQIITKSIQFVLPIAAAPYLEVSGTEVVSGFAQGTDANEIRVFISNTGTNEAEEVRVRLIPDISFPFLFERTTQYVASTLEPGETTSIAFRTEIDADAEVKDYEVTVRLESLVGEARYIQDDTVAIPVNPGTTISPRAAGITVLLVVLGIAIALGLFNWLRGKKKARRKK